MGIHKPIQVEDDQNEDDFNNEEESEVVEKLTTVPMVLDKQRGLIYYVKEYAG